MKLFLSYVITSLLVACRLIRGLLLNIVSWRGKSSGFRSQISCYIECTASRFRFLKCTILFQRNTFCNVKKMFPNDVGFATVYRRKLSQKFDSIPSDIAFYSNMH